MDHLRPFLLFLLTLSLLALHAPALVTATLTVTDVTGDPSLAPEGPSLASTEVTSNASTDPADATQNLKAHASAVVKSKEYSAFYGSVYSNVKSMVTRKRVQRLTRALESYWIPSYSATRENSRRVKDDIIRATYRTFRRYLPVCDVTASDPFFLANHLQLQSYLGYSYDETTRKFSLPLKVNEKDLLKLESVMDRPDNTCKLFYAINTLLGDFFLLEGAHPMQHMPNNVVVDRDYMDYFFVALVKIIYECQGDYNPFDVKWENLLQKQIEATTLKFLATPNHPLYRVGADLDRAILTVLRWIRAGPYLMQDVI